MADLGTTFRTFIEKSKGTYDRKETARRLAKKAAKKEAATGVAIDGVIALDHLNKGRLDKFNELAANRLQTLVNEGRDPTDTMALIQMVKDGKLDKAKDELRQLGVEAQMRDLLPKDDEQIQRILGIDTTAKETAEAKLQTELSIVEKNKAASQKSLADIALDKQKLVQDKLEFQKEQELAREQLAVDAGKLKPENVLKKKNIDRLTDLNKSQVSRQGMLIAAQDLLESFKEGTMESGTTRRVLGWFPGVFTDQAQRDQELDALSEEIARTRLKAVGEIRPTDADVEGMKTAGPSVKWDEGTNMTLLERFLREQQGIMQEQEALRNSQAEGTLSYFTGDRPNLTPAKVGKFSITRTQ